MNRSVLIVERVNYLTGIQHKVDTDAQQKSDDRALSYELTQWKFIVKFKN